MFAQKMKASDVFNVKCKQQDLKRSKSRPNEVLIGQQITTQSDFKPSKKVITVKSNVFSEEGSQPKLNRSKSKPSTKPKESIYECLQSPVSVIAKNKEVSNFVPKYNNNTRNSIKQKNDAQTFSCVGNNTVNACPQTATEVVPQSIVIRKRNKSEFELNPKEMKLKSIYPDMSVEEIRLLTKNRETEALNLKASSNGIKEKDDNIHKVKVQKLLESNIFNNKQKSILNEKQIHKLREEQSNPKKKVEEIQKPNYNRRALTPKKPAIEEQVRPKSGKDRRIEELTKTNIFNVVKEEKTVPSEPIFRRKPDENTLIDKFSEFNTNSSVNPLKQSHKALPKSSNDYTAKCYIVKTHLTLKEEEVKRLLTKEGLHVTQIKSDFNILSNDKLNDIEITIRSEPKQNDERILGKLFKSSDVLAKAQQTKINAKPKSDLIGGSKIKNFPRESKTPGATSRNQSKISGTSRIST